jgi:hypothetical protein
VIPHRLANFDPPWTSLPITKSTTHLSPQHHPYPDHPFIPLKGPIVIMADNEYNAEEAAGTIDSFAQPFAHFGCPTNPFSTVDSQN